MTLREFLLSIDGWNNVHGAGEKPAAPSEDEFEQWKEAINDNG